MGETLQKIRKVLNEFENEAGKTRQHQEQLCRLETAVQRQEEDLRTLQQAEQEHGAESGRLNETIQLQEQRIQELENRIRTMGQDLAQLHGNLQTREADLESCRKQLERMLPDQELEKIKIRQNQERLDRIEQVLFKTNSLWNKVTNAQCGEDAIVAYIFIMLNIAPGECRYLDLGANRPIELSNTYYFYSQGANGVLVEANPALIPELRNVRRRDTVVNKCVSTGSGQNLKFYVMSGDGLSTTEWEEVEAIQKINPEITLKETIEVESITVNELFETYFTEAPEICSLDIEGKDMEILQSIDFEKHRPLIFIIEMIEYSTKLVVGQKNQEILAFMRSVGYTEFAFTGINSVFIDQRYLDAM